MRIRQVKPEFWRDSIIAELPDTTRLVYIGLWGEADDAGYLRLNITEIANDLYPYTGRTLREKRVTEAIGKLVEAKRIEVQPCQQHGHILHLTEHQRLAAPEKRVTTIQREHRMRCAEPAPGSPPAETRGDLQTVAGEASPLVPATFHTSPTRNGTVRRGKGRNGTGGYGGSAVGADADDQRNGESTSEFQARMVAAGLAGKH